jgi:predicted ATPase with chaperone activity
VTINLAPADVRKEVSGFDLPMALGLAGCMGQFFGKPLDKCMFLGRGLSARAHDRILKAARTIADLEDADNIAPKHLSEAIQ